MTVDVTVTLIDQIEHVPRTLKFIGTHQCMALDLEGVSLGRSGQITMLQIATSASNVISFDILKLGPKVFPLLQPILEDPSKFKLCYDARCDADALYHNHGISLRGIIDIQVMYTIVYQHPTDPYLKGLSHTLAMPGVVEARYLDGVLRCKIAGKNNMKLQGHRIFTKRPLSLQVLQYCALDVIYLFPMYAQWAPLCDINYILFLSRWRCCAYVSGSAAEIKARIMSIVDFDQRLFF